MKIGELFVELGMKGGEKLKDSLADTNKGMKDLSSRTLETQAHLISLTKVSVALGASIGEISRRGSEAGKSLELFHKFTGQSVVPVQQMAHNLAISTDEAVKLAESLTDVFATIKLEGGKNYFGTLGIDLDKIKTYKEYILALQTAANKTPASSQWFNIINKALMAEGLNPDIIGQLRRTKNVFAPISPEASISGAESKSAATISDQWTNLGNNLTTLETKLAVTFGPPLVKSLNDFTLGLSKITGFFEKEENKHASIGGVIGTSASALTFGAGAAGAGWAASVAGLIAAPELMLPALFLSGAALPFIHDFYKNFMTSGDDSFISSMMKGQGSVAPKLDLTIHQTVLPNTSGRKETRTSKQTKDFDSKGGEVNQTYQQNISPEQ